MLPLAVLRDGSESKQSNENKNTLKTIGLAVFKQDKLVGYLSPVQTLAHLIITNELDNSTVAIPSPFEKNQNIDLYVTPRWNTKIKIDLIDNKPVINVDVHLSAKISSISGSHKFLNEENIKIVEDAANEYIEQIILDYFNVTTKKYKTDIAGLGKYLVNKFLTWDDWSNFNWLDSYQYSSYNVNVNTTITSSYLLLET